MNLVQLAEHAKNLSNQQLQQMLQSPDGSMPPFLLAAEAARRQDIERSAQVPQDTGTVLDELIQGRAQASGGLNALQPQQPQPMRGGGEVKRYAGGALVGPGVGMQPALRPEEMPSFSGFWDFLTKPRSLVGQSATDPFAREVAGVTDPIPSASGVRELDPVEDLGEKQKLARYQTRIKDDAAAQKEQENADKNREMGNPEGTTEEGGGETDEYRERLASILNSDDEDVQRLLGFSSSGLARMGAALLSRERGLSEGQRWANAAAAMAEDTETRDRSRQKNEMEDEMAFLKYDMAKSESDQAKEDAAIAQIREGYSGQADYNMKAAAEVRQRMSDIQRQYSSTDPMTGMITGSTEPPPEVQAELKRLQDLYNQLIGASQGYNVQGAGILGIEPMGVRMPDGSIKYGQ